MASSTGTSPNSPRSRNTGGAGLGLAIAKHFIEAHHGRIEVTSTTGIGSTFTIELPRKVDPNV